MASMRRFVSTWSWLLHVNILMHTSYIMQSSLTYRCVDVMGGRSRKWVNNMEENSVVRWFLLLFRRVSHHQPELRLFEKYGTEARCGSHFTKMIILNYYFFIPFCFAIEILEGMNSRSDVLDLRWEEAIRIDSILMAFGDDTWHLLGSLRFFRPSWPDVKITVHWQIQRLFHRKKRHFRNCNV